MKQSSLAEDRSLFHRLEALVLLLLIIPASYVLLKGHSAAILPSSIENM